MSRSFSALVCCSILVCSLSSVDAAESKLRAGAAAIDVSPTKFPVIVNGSFLSRTVDKVADPFHARALVLDDGKTKLAICVVDSCVLPRDLLDAAKAEASKATGIPAANMLVSATHSHSAPSVMGVLGTDADPNYPPVLQAGIAKAIVTAHANLAPATVAWGISNANEYTGIRRWIRRPDRIMKDPYGELTLRANMHPGHMSVDAIAPSGPEDPDLTVLSVRSPDGKPIALLANFAMHYFGGVQGASADYFGRFCNDVAKELKRETPEAGKPPFVAIMSQGTSGDGWRVDYGKPKPTITIDQYANDLAMLAIKAVAEKPHRDADIAMAAAEIKIKARLATPERLEWAKKVVAEMGDRLPKNQTEVLAREAIFLSKRPEADMLLQAIRVGDFGITAMPNEVYALTGLKIKAASPLAATMNVELANDELGYIPPPEQFPLGGYTTWAARSSYGAPDSEPRMVETVITLLEKVAGKPRREIKDSHGAYAQAIIEDKPLAYWRMNEMAGDSAHDALGKTPARYETGVVFYLDGPASDSFSGKGIINRSPHFAGGRMTADLGKALPASYAVEMWFWNGLAHEARPVTGYLFSRGTPGDKQAAGDNIGIGGTHAKDGDIKGRLIFFNGNEHGRTVAGRTLLTPKTWNHLVFVRNANRVLVYLNGQPDPDIAIEAEPTFATGGTVFFGGRCDNFSNLEGKLDEVAVYAKVVRPEEVAAHYRIAGVQPPPPTTAPAATATTQPAAVSGMRPTPPKSPEESAKLLHVKEGYVAELVVHEPLVMDPVAFSFGPDGRLWVIEMSDYPYGADGKMKACGRVRYLQDTNGDGKFDKSVVLAEDLNFPTGVLPWRNGVIVTAAPDILYLEDTKNTGKADKIEVLYTGFTQGNPQLRVNSPMYGLDNWVYIANGLSSKGTVKSLKTGKEVAVSGRDVRIRPDTGEIETETGQSQFGRRMDDYGDWFGVHNSFPARHFVIPEKYSKRNPHAALPNGQYDMGFPSNPKVYPVSEGMKRYGAAFFAQSGRFTSACSVTPYRDRLLFGPPTTFGGPQHVFTCEPVHNLVQHNVLTAAGSTFSAGRAEDEQFGEFLASEDQWFRPVFLASAPDGALWVADMYRFMIEHPDWLPPEGKQDYRPYYRMGEDKGRIYRVYPKGQTPRAIPRLDRLKTPDLVKLLELPNGPQRDQVQAMLVWRNDPSAVGRLTELAAKSQQPLARMHALCTLDGINALKPDAIEKALADAHPAVRRQAIRLAEPLAGKTASLLAAALKLAEDAEPKVRLQLAFSIGEWDGADAGAALVKVARSAGDDLYLSAAVMSSAAKHYKALADGLLKEPGAPAGIRRDLLAMALAKNDRELVGRLVFPILWMREGWYANDQYEAFAQFLDLLSQQKTTIAKLAGKEKDDLAKALENVPGLFAAARKAAAADSAPEDRLAPIALLGRDPANFATDAKLLADLYKSSAPPAFQSAVVRSLARIDLPEVPAALTSEWDKRPLQVKGAVADALLTREPWAFALLERVQAGDVPVLDIDAARRQRLLRHASPRVKTLAGKVLGELADGGRAKVIEAYRPAMTMPGDAARGQKVFANNCATCHKQGDVGNDIGPNLISVAGWPADALVTGMLDPSRSAEPRYLAFNCTLDTGEVVYGLVLRETPAGVTMKLLDGQERTIPRRQVKSLESTNRSLMPDGLEQAIDHQAMADVIQFLKSQKP